VGIFFMRCNEDKQKLDQVRKALRDGDVKRASRLAHVYQLLPVSA
jgi:hypothetical protein